MRNLPLKEHLIDDGDTDSELPATTTGKRADAELERAVEDLGLGCPCGTPAEDALQRAIVVSYRIVVVVSGQCIFRVFCCRGGARGDVSLFASRSRWL